MSFHFKAHKRLVLLPLAAVILGLVLFLPLTFQNAPAPSGQTTEAQFPPDIFQRLADEIDIDAFEPVSGPWEVSLPRDFGGHTEAQGETWLVTSHLQKADGSLVGVQLSLARFGLRSEIAGSNDDAWALHSLYRGHVIVISQEQSAIHAEERFSRGMGAAGHDLEASEVWLDDWTLSYGTHEEGQQIVLTAALDEMRLELVLTPLNAPIRSMDQETPLRAFTMPRLAVTGQLATDAGVDPVSGTAWLDRAWGELPIPGGPLAYDRLQMHLDDGTALSLVRTRRRDGRGAITVDGLLVRASGEQVSLSSDDIAISSIGTEGWLGTAGAAPLAWQIVGAGLDIRVEEVIGNQMKDFALGGWNGLVRAEGFIDDNATRGLGTLQMTDQPQP